MRLGPNPTRRRASPRRARPPVVATEALSVDGIDVAVERKRIRRIYIRVHSSEGSVRVSAPVHVHIDEIVGIVRERATWILRHRERIAGIERPTAPELVTGEIVRAFGVEYSLVVAKDPTAGRAGTVTIAPGTPPALHLTVPPNSDRARRTAILDRWYRAELAARCRALRATWEPVVGAEATELRLKRMKTLWGSCNPRARRIWLNLELARHSERSIEYVLVHELVHLHERLHNRRFYSIMDRVMPDWRERKAELNRVAPTMSEG